MFENFRNKLANDLIKNGQKNILNNIKYEKILLKQLTEHLQLYPQSKSYIFNSLPGLCSLSQFHKTFIKSNKLNETIYTEEFFIELLVKYTDLQIYRVNGYLWDGQILVLHTSKETYLSNLNQVNSVHFSERYENDESLYLLVESRIQRFLFKNPHHDFNQESNTPGFCFLEDLIFIIKIEHKDVVLKVIKQMSGTDLFNINSVTSWGRELAGTIIAFGKPDKLDNYNTIGDYRGLMYSQANEDYERSIKFYQLQKSERVDSHKEQIISVNSNMQLSDNSTNEKFKCSSEKGLQFDVGILDNGEKFSVRFANGSADYFAIIGGRPGFGKSVLLHNIILSGSASYSPDELEFFLFDYANGNSFVGFDKLPHVKILSITNEREYGISTLNSIFKEMETRSDLFKVASKQYETNIGKYEDYRNITNHILPRIVIIIDEFQVLLTANDRLSYLAGKNIENIIKEARKYGIHLILCTQKYIGIGIDISLVTLRIAFNLSAIDSEKIIGNNSASKLSEIGQAVTNNRNGENEFNVYFRTVYNENIFGQISEIISHPAIAKYQVKNRIIYDSIISSDISNNLNIEDGVLSSKESKQCTVYLGKPKYLADNDLHFRLRNSYRNNILYTGHDITGSIRSILLSTYQILSQSRSDSKVYILNNTHQSERIFDYQKELKSIPPNISFHQPSEVDDIINELHNILTSRLSPNSPSDVNNISRIIFVGINLDTLKQFREIKHGFSSNNDDTRSKLIDLLRNGPEVSIHSIIYTPLVSNLNIMLGSNSLVELFSIRIITKGQQDLRGILELKQEDIPIKTGHCYLRLEDPFEGESLMFNPDPFVIYNMYSNSISEYVDSIFDNEKLNEN